MRLSGVRFKDQCNLSRQSLAESVSFSFIRYANCWEDADILCESLQPGPGKRILSIASAGDNALALLGAGAEVVAADLSTAQLACLELRCAAFRRLDYDQVLSFLGVRPADDRLKTFECLAEDLAPERRDFWRKHPQVIAEGIIHAGKFEAYFRLFRRWVLPLIHSKTKIEKLMDVKDRDARYAFWNSWNNRRWQLLFRVFFGRTLMGRLGRDPEFFRYVEGGISQRLMDRVRHGLTELPTHANPFLDYIVFGNFCRMLPRYLRPENFQKVRSNLEGLTLYHGSIEQAGRLHLSKGFDAFNLSDIFEYLDVETASSLYGDLVELANPGARLAYWNTLVPRGRPAHLADRVQPLDELSAELLERDLAFFYGEFHVDEVRIEGCHTLASDCAASI